MKKCEKCGAKVSSRASYCSVCGNNTFVADNGNDKSTLRNVLIGIVIGVVIAGAAFRALSRDDDVQSTSATKFSFSYETVTPDISASEVTDIVTTTATTKKYVQPTATTEYNSSTTKKDSFSAVEIELNSDIQYTLNLFLSNFSEANMKSFTDYPSVEEMVNFSLSFNFINRRENFEELNSPVELNGKTYNYRIKRTDVYSPARNYFSLITLVSDFGKHLPNYKNDYFYYSFTGGMIMDDISIVTAVRQVERYLYEVDFNLYDAASNNRNMYTMNDAQVRAEMNSKPFIRYAGSGTALVHSSNIQDHNSCRLFSYNLD